MAKSDPNRFLLIGSSFFLILKETRLEVFTFGEKGLVAWCIFYEVHLSTKKP